MRSNLKKRLEHRIGKEIATKTLTEYMNQHGYDNMNLLVYPPSIHDIAFQPDTFKKVELVAFPEETDPTSNAVTVGWNLFVLGTNRLYLGSTTHNSIADLQGGGLNEGAEQNLEKTAGEVVDFIVRILETNQHGFRRHSMDSGSSQPGLPTNKPRIGPSASGGYYERNKIV